MSDLYVCEEYETPYSEGYRVIRTIEEHNKIIYNQALEDFAEQFKAHCKKFTTKSISDADIDWVKNELKE